MAIVNLLVDKLTGYIRIKGEKLKLEIIAIVAKLLAHLVAFLMLGFIGFFLLVFLSISLGAYLNMVLESTFWGYVIVSGIFFIFFLAVVLLLKSQKIQNWLEAAFIRISDTVPNEDEDEDE